MAKSGLCFVLSIAPLVFVARLGETELELELEPTHKQVLRVELVKLGVRCVCECKRPEPKGTRFY